MYSTIASFRISLSSAETALKLLAGISDAALGDVVSKVNSFISKNVTATVAAICTVVAAIMQWHDTLDCSIQGLVQLLTKTTATLGKLFNWLFALAQLLAMEDHNIEILAFRFCQLSLPVGCGQQHFWLVQGEQGILHLGSLLQC